MDKHAITSAPASAGVASSTAITETPKAAVAAQPLLPEDQADRPGRRTKHPAWQALEAVASLRITVVLFVLSFMLVFWGTLAQVDRGIWTVVEQYFRWWVVWIPVRVLSFFTIDAPIAIPFPGGWTLGALLMTNLLAAHIVRFRLTWKRSGILVLHAGIVIMMVGEFITGVYQVEAFMTIMEGESSNFVESSRNNELAFIDMSDPKVDDVTVIPARLLRNGGTIRHGALPVDVEVHHWMRNSVLVDAKDVKDNPATAGFGLDTAAVEKPEVTGTDPDQKIDAPSTYVTLTDKATGKALGTWFVSLHLKPQTLEIGGKPYELSLRPRRSYRDFSLHLEKFVHERYPNSHRSKTFTSKLLLTDTEAGEKDRKVTITMNDPLRHRGETFYQASFIPGDRGTVLQVVSNPGWLMPYISCALVTLGMMFHFGLNLVSFLERRLAR